MVQQLAGGVEGRVRGSELEVIANPIMRKLYCSVDGASSGGFFGGVEGIRGAGAQRESTKSFRCIFSSLFIFSSCLCEVGQTYIKIIMIR
jgi:hypothetical protein